VTCVAAQRLPSFALSSSAARRPGRALLTLVWLSALAACRAPTPTPTPDQLLERSAQAMQSLTSVHFSIERSGAPAYVDPTGTFAFRRAEGDFVAPDRARAQVRVIGPGLVAEVNVVALGDDYWESHPLTGEWGNYSGFGYNPAALFDPEAGLAAFMRRHLTDLRLLGLDEIEDLPGEQFFHLAASAPGEPVLAMTAGLVGRGRLAFEWWAEPDTARVIRIRVVEPETDPADPTVWIIDFDLFDQPAAIEAPAP